MSEVIEIRIDDDGRLVVPKTLRERLGLTPGMTLTVEAETDGDVLLRPEAETSRLIVEDGVLVVDAEPLEDLSTFVQNERERRAAELIARIGQ